MSDSGGASFAVLTDAPVGGGGDDLLETTQVARGLADLIVASRLSAPFALAVDAAWGMGKSSLMRRLEDILSAEPGVSTIWFNAWTSGQASALEGLIKSVLLRFDRNIIRRALRSMSQRAHLLGLLRLSALIVGSFFGVGRVVDEIWRRMVLDAQSRNEIKGVLRDAFDAWQRPDQRRLLVVFVDDLDRCDSERVIEVCEAIKLYLDVPGIVFVLACDQTALWRAVRESAGIAEPSGAVEYLEKIIQINYRIPAPSPSAVLRLVNGYLHQSGTSNLFDDAMRSVIIERSGRNPRRIKRLINSFVLEYHLNRGQWHEVGVANLVKVVLLQHFYPAFYGTLIDPRNDDVDPISQFRDYHELRANAPEEGLADLERELPPEFPALAEDRDFVALIESFGEKHNVEQVRRLLRRSPLTVGPDYAPIGPGSELRAAMRVPIRDDTPVTVRGLHILWIDDKPFSNGRLIQFLEDHGATVATATDRASAVTEIGRVRPDVILSDLTRDGDSDAGLDDAEFLRANGLFDGLVIFSSGRGSPAQVRRAGEFGALGPTNDENDIVRWLSFAYRTKHDESPQ